MANFPTNQTANGEQQTTRRHVANRKRLKLQCIECIAKSASVIHMVHMQREQSIHVGYEYLRVSLGSFLRNLLGDAARSVWRNETTVLSRGSGLRSSSGLSSKQSINILELIRQVSKGVWTRLTWRLAEFIGPRGSDRVLKWPQQVERTRWGAKELWILNMLVGFPWPWLWQTILLGH